MRTARSIAATVAAGHGVIDETRSCPAANTGLRGIKPAAPFGPVRAGTARTVPAAGPVGLDPAPPRVPAGARVDAGASTLSGRDDNLNDNYLEDDRQTPIIDNDNYPARWGILVVAVGRNSCRCAAGRGAQQRHAPTGQLPTRGSVLGRATLRHVAPPVPVG
jgi:hypothetical protein